MSKSFVRFCPYSPSCPYSPQTTVILPVAWSFHEVVFFHIFAEERCIDTAQYPYQCDVCHIPFMSKSKFMHHQRRHTEENPFLCTYCGESFRRFDELSKHRDELHLCNKTFRCGQCPKSFSSKKELETHMWRHTGISHCYVSTK